MSRRSNGQLGCEAIGRDPGRGNSWSVVLVVWAAVLALPSLAGCVDPSSRLDGFSGRVVDADLTRPDGSGGLYDVSGQFLATITPGFAPNAQLQFLATVSYSPTAGGATIDLSFQPLWSANCQDPTPDQIRTPVGDPLVVTGTAVNAGGAFDLTFMDATVDARANALLCGDIVADVELSGTLKSTDLFCGAVAGNVKQPIPASLDGSTFAAIRVADGTIGNALPDPVGACPLPADGGP